MSRSSHRPRVSLTTATLYHLPLRRAFSLAAKAGFEGVELAMTPATWCHSPDQIRHMANALKLRIFSVHPTTFGWSPSGRGEFAALLNGLEVAQELGCPTVVVHAPLLKPDSGPGAAAWEQMVIKLARRTRGSQTRLAVENQGTYLGDDAHFYLGRVRAMRDFAAAHDLDLTLDACHMGTAGRLLPEALDLVRPRLADVHLSDMRPAPRLQGHPFWHTILAQHMLPGRGGLPLDAFLEHLVASDYRGPVTLELSPAASRIWNPLALRRNLAEGAAVIRRGTGSADS